MKKPVPAPTPDEAVQLALEQAKKLSTARKSVPKTPRPSVILPASPPETLADEGHTELKKRQGLSFWDKRKLAKHPDQCFLITMHYSNGTTRSFVVRAKGETFQHKKRVYYLRFEDGWYDLTFGQYHLHYWDDCSVPISREFQRKGDEAFFTVTPENLKPLLKMEYIKVLAQSHEINKYLRAILALTLVVGIASLAGAVLAWEIYGKVKGLH